MNLNYDNWLLVISIVASSASLLIAFAFIRRLYLSTASSKKIMLPIYSFAVGLAIWANHFLVSLGFHPDAKLNSPMLAMAGLFFSVIIGFGLLFISSQSYSKIRHFMLLGLIASLSDLGLFYCSSNAIHEANLIKFNPMLTFLATCISGGITTVIAMLFYWIRAYAGRHPNYVKVLLATGIALAIFAIHIVFESAITHKTELVSVASNQASRQLVSITIGLGMICLFMLLFIFTLFFEKHGKQLFEFSFFKKGQNSESQPQITLDSLTKLPNRKAFQDHLESASKRSTRAGSTFALAYIDLDHFKPVNDQFGHHVGDIVLKTVAERLNAAIRGCDFIARIGGDEFVAILEEIKTNEDISPIVQRILKSVKESFHVNNLNIEISCSVGIAIYPKDGDLEKLMVCADAAMYKAKENGKNQSKFYDSDIESASEQMLELQRDLCLALERNEFILKYQPKIDCKTQAPLGAEALIRWNHPIKGEILPKSFLPAAERFGLINEINDWIVDETCRMISHAKEQSGINLNVSINLSSHQFRNPNLVKDILKTIKFYDLDSENLTFEIKETSAIRNQEQFKLLLGKFNEAGIKVVLDDFGLHPISLAYLQDLNVNEIKLDKSFVSDINQDKSSRSLIDALIKLAHALDLHVVAEGVETEAQRDALVELGCDYMQGYLFSEPVQEVKLFALYKHLQSNQLQINFETSEQISTSEYKAIPA